MEDLPEGPTVKPYNIVLVRNFRRTRRFRARGALAKSKYLMTSSWHGGL